MYANNSSTIKLDGNLAEPIQIKTGVRQGDILSPLLFNIFINDIIQEFNSQECYPPSLINEQVGSLLYADDLVIMSTSVAGLQNSMNKLSSYCSKWKMQVNMSKTKLMCLTKSRNSCNLNITLYNNQRNTPYAPLSLMP